MVVFKDSRKKQCLLASGQGRNILLHRQVATACGTALLLPFPSMLPVLSSSTFQPRTPIFAKLTLCGHRMPLEEC